ncbi:MAG TPA: hypothetical protein VFA56_08110 [Gaiellaceae bacterium]|nr:hypothetical protein [Gaiellaceae bacterium]
MQHVDAVAVPVELRRNAQRFLLDVARPGDGMFPYSTTVRDGKYVNTFDHPQTVRYTINSLLGLQAAAQRDPEETDAAKVDALTSAFLEKRADAVANPADLGLLLVLLAEMGLSEDRARATLQRIRPFAERAASLTMQELAWLVWGACAAVRAGLDGARDLAAQLAGVLVGEYVEPASGLPRHNTSAYRRGVVSFGATVYFLRALHEYAATAEDSRAADLFSNGVRRIVDIQGEQGEWPWMIGVRSGRPLDFYPVFAVHQDSMAMLFLLPALAHGLDVVDAIERSLAWVDGRNELGIPMTTGSPFVAYRSIERAERAPRARRYLRAALNGAAGRADAPAAGHGVRLNPECRSYHLGWILYAWSGVRDLPSGRRPAP